MAVARTHRFSIARSALELNQPSPCAVGIAVINALPEPFLHTGARRTVDRSAFRWSPFQFFADFDADLNQAGPQRPVCLTR